MEYEFTIFFISSHASHEESDMLVYDNTRWTMTENGENFRYSVWFIPIQHQFVQLLGKQEQMFA